MSSKRKHQDHINHERWLVSYADFITLLFAFFVVMYAIAMQDKAKAKALAEAIRASFEAIGATSTMPADGTRALPGVPAALPGSRQNRASPGAASSQADPSAAGATNVLPEPALQAANGSASPSATAISQAAGPAFDRFSETPEIKRLTSTLETNISVDPRLANQAQKVQLLFDERGLVVRLSANDFFLPGKAEVRTEALPLLAKLGQSLKQAKHPIRIEGHTDDRAVDSEDFPSNWELSAGRAAWVVRYLVKKYSFNPALLSAVGRAEFHPVADNGTEIGRGKNRRVEIVVLRQEAF